MKTALCFVLLTIYSITMTYCQQCRQVTSTVCDDDITSFSRQKGDKGEVGFPGKSGIQGIKGSKGDSGGVGEKGTQGESCALGSLDLEDFVRPDSCTNSLLDGNQFLRNGLKVYCEDRWTVFQRRFDGSVNFQRTWDEYKVGFGETEGEFWLGLETVRRLTRKGNCDLRIELKSFDDSFHWAQYSTFSVDSEADLYRLHVGGYTGNATDALISTHNNQAFTTLDMDNDKWSRNCATENDGETGGWWYNACKNSQLNALWGRDGYLFWSPGAGSRKASTMKFRCD
ncbi:angiopoietin-related protein 1-like isoform X2 [Clavelina lepadiformis]|uniref:Fibrinogen C-terminal domain-containing protein n=1 Tax=Clavelina lepadiformis TaxID=159417 RepID=A0ABP0FYN2_CLALP